MTLVSPPDTFRKAQSGSGLLYEPTIYAVLPSPFPSRKTLLRLWLLDDAPNMCLAVLSEKLVLSVGKVINLDRFVAEEKWCLCLLSQFQFTRTFINWLSIKSCPVPLWMFCLFIFNTGHHESNLQSFPKNTVVFTLRGVKHGAALYSRDLQIRT